MTLGMTSNPGNLIPDASTEILQQLEILRQRTQESGEDLRRMEQEQEAFALEYHELSKITANLKHLQTQPQSPQRQEFEKQLRIKKELSEQKLNQKVIFGIPLINWGIYSLTNLIAYTLGCRIVANANGFSGEA